MEATIGTVAIAQVLSKDLNFVHHLIDTNNWKEVRVVFVLLAVAKERQVDDMRFFEDSKPLIEWMRGGYTITRTYCFQMQ